LLKGFRNPGIIVFYDKFRHFRPFFGRQGFELLDYFRGAHA